MKGDHDSITSHGSSGIAFTDEESIIAHLDNFCNHIRSMIDVIHTLSQFSKLANEVQNLPRVTVDVITNSHAMEDDQVTSEMHLKTDAGGLRPAEAAASIGSGSEHSYPGIMSMKNKIDTITVHLHFPWAKLVSKVNIEDQKVIGFMYGYPRGQDEFISPTDQACLVKMDKFQLCSVFLHLFELWQSY